MIDIIDYSCQAAVTCTGFFSLYLLASQDAKTRMYAGIVGMIGEPFWLTTAVINEQWGLVKIKIEIELDTHEDRDDLLEIIELLKVIRGELDE